MQFTKFYYKKVHFLLKFPQFSYKKVLYPVGDRGPCGIVT